MSNAPPAFKTEKPVVARHALVGIVAVLLAAVVSSLGSGMISSGIEDLRGAWGLGIDDAAYISTAFSGAQMFMGPFAIILAARYGHRPVLMFCGYVYVITSLILPFAPRMVMTHFILIISGLASGTFYPLTLSFITRNLPMRLVPYGVAAYTMDLLGGNHVTQAMEGYFLDHLSWHWIFWNQAILTLPMLLCVHYGITATPKEQLIPKCDYTGVLYLSGGLTALYIALDQGERLDWYNNGLINGLVIAGVLLLTACAIRRVRAPNPFIDLGYLKSRNVLVLGVLIVLFRVILLRAVVIVPVFLEQLHQYRTPEIGNLLLLSLAPYLVALPVVAFFMGKVHVRIIMAIGFFTLAIINFYDSHALSTWIGNDFIVQQCIGSVALCMAVLGTMSGTVFEGRLTGAYRNRAGAYSQGAFFQVVRLFGSEASSAGLRRFVQVREHFWQTKLVSDLGSNWQYNDRIGQLSIALAPQAAGPLQRPEIAAGLVAGSVHAQSFTLAIDDVFMLVSLVSFFALIAIFMMKPIPLPHQLPDADAPLS
jgi:MFS transporter, DHA2 family, multidrug resistance protein